MDQYEWHEAFESRHTYGIPVPHTCTGVRRPRAKPEVIMARTIKLPARANAISYEPSDVLDALLTLADTPKGEGVVIDDAQDSEPKARARCRTMAAALKDGVTIALDALSADEQKAYKDDADENGDVTFDGMEVRTHVVPEGDAYLPVLSRKA